MGNMRRYGAPGNPETDEGREQRSGLIILQRSKDLMKYLYTSFVKYPRSEKLGFVADYKKCLFQFLILIITAQKKYFKKTTLQDADVQLELLRMFNDLSYDMKFVDEKRYILVSEKLCEIGRLLGGWPENNFRQREQVKNACRLSLAVTTTLRTLALPR